jgi:hypothetical protein
MGLPLDAEALTAAMKAEFLSGEFASDLPPLDDLCANIVNSVVDHLNARLDWIPVGLISMWSGTIATIPSGWRLCDGTNGTPDLRDKFIVGATADEAGAAKTNVTGSLTQSGGAATHDHNDHTVTQPAAHSDLTHTGLAVGDHAALSHSGAGVGDHSYTPAGTVSQPTFTGDALANHGHTAGTLAVTAHTGRTSPQGSGASVAVFNNASDLNHAITGAPADATGGTPAGTVSTPTFSGTPATLSHSVTQAGDHAAQGHSVTAPADHSLSAHSGAAVDAHSSESNLDPYYALAFIIKVAA